MSPSSRPWCGNSRYHWLERTNGKLGYFAGAPLDNGSREVVMVTLWSDTDALKSFVGELWQTPVVTEDEVPLVEEMFAHHYTRFDKEVLLAE